MNRVHDGIAALYKTRMYKFRASIFIQITRRYEIAPMWIRHPSDCVGRVKARSHPACEYDLISVSTSSIHHFTKTRAACVSLQRRRYGSITSRTTTIASLESVTSSLACNTSLISILIFERIRFQMDGMYDICMIFIKQKK